MSKKKNKTTKQSSVHNEQTNGELIEEIFAQPKNEPRVYMIKVSIYVGIIAALVGIIAGVVGVMVLLSGTLSRIPLFGAFSLESILPERQVIIRPQQDVTVVRDQQLESISETLKPSIVVFATKRNQFTQLDSRNQYTQDDVLGYGYVLSSDGWIVTLNEIFAQHEQTDVVAISSAGALYTVENIIVDKTTDTAFVRINASMLRAATFAPSTVVRSSTSLFSLTYMLPTLETVVDEVTVAYMSIPPFVQTSEELTKEMVVTNVNQRVVAPVVNFAGEIVGLQHGIYSNGTAQQAFVRPIYHITSQIQQVLSIQQIIRPVVGIEWVSLSGNPGLPESIRNGMTKGVYVSAVHDSSPAQKAGVEEGDIITALNEQELNGGLNFSEMIQQFGISDTILLSGIRNGLKIEFVVSLARVVTE